jgi:Tfp pilus assembly protein PilX
MKARTGSQAGFALVTAVLSTTFVLALGLGALALVDGVQKRSGRERVSETAYNVAEAALTGEVIALSGQWPGTAQTAVPATCTQASAQTGCPSPSTISQSFAATDFNSSATWTVTVRDDLGSAQSYYSQSVLNSTACGSLVPCTWDSNADGQMWVRASATVDGATRTLVALVQRDQVRIGVPRNVITAGYFSTNNTGDKVIVDELGSSSTPAPVAVRCTTSTPGQSGDPCLGYIASKGQLSPNNVQQGYQGNVLSPAALNQLRTQAQQAGTYYTTCPSTTQATAPLVFVEGVNCSYIGGNFNSASAPGTLVINQGTLSLAGNVNFYGLVILANNLTPPADSGFLLSMTGTSYIQGSVIVEGNGGVSAGASKLNISFDPSVLGNLLGSAGTASVVQNSFRELPAGQ